MSFLAENDSKFVELNGRSVLSYGEPYSYNGSPKDSTKDATPMPEIIDKLISKINDEFENSCINSCLINKYVGAESFLPEHADKEQTIKTNSLIFTIYLGEMRDVIFRDSWSSNTEHLSTTSRSLYTISQPSQGFWTHRIDACESLSENSTRYSITLRSVDRKYVNSTIILGDSNTKFLTFGDKRRAFGGKIHGQRVEALTIQDIDPEVCIGYQNVVVHVGVNNLKSTRIPGFYDTEDINVRDVFMSFKHKINTIRVLCPKSKIIISPILPTKIAWLNKRAKEFNMYLFDEICVPQMGQLQTLDFDVFLDKFGFLSDTYGSFKNKADKIHLGRQGIRRLALSIRNEVLSARSDSKSYAGAVNDKKSHVGGRFLS